MTEKRVPDYRGGGPGFRATAEALKLPKGKPTDADRPPLRPFPGRRVKPLPGQISLEAELERVVEADAKEARS